MLNNGRKKSFLSHSKRINCYCSLYTFLYLFPDSHIRPTIQPGALPLFMMCVMMLYPILFQMRPWMSFSLSLCSLLFILTGKWRLKGRATGLNLSCHWRFSRRAKEDEECLIYCLASYDKYKPRYFKMLFPIFRLQEREAVEAKSLVSLLPSSKYKGYNVTKYICIISDIKRGVGNLPY